MSFIFFSTKTITILEELTGSHLGYGNSVLSGTLFDSFGVCFETQTHSQEVHRFYASSKTCSKCQNKKKALELKDRTYHCESCGFELDIDKNASINIRKESVRICAQIKKTG